MVWISVTLGQHAEVTDVARQREGALLGQSRRVGQALRLRDEGRKGKGVTGKGGVETDGKDGFEMRIINSGQQLEEIAQLQVQLPEDHRAPVDVRRIELPAHAAQKHPPRDAPDELRAQAVVIGVQVHDPAKGRQEMLQDPFGVTFMPGDNILSAHHSSGQSVGKCPS